MISVIASSETVSIVKFTSFITNSVTHNDVGIAIITTSALRQERRKNSIAMPVNTMPSSSVYTTLSSWFTVKSAWTLSTRNCDVGELRFDARQRGLHRARGGDLARARALQHVERDRGQPADVRIDALGLVAVAHGGDVADPRQARLGRKRIRRRARRARGDRAGAQG